MVNRKLPIDATLIGKIPAELCLIVQRHRRMNFRKRVEAFEQIFNPYRPVNMYDYRWGDGHYLVEIFSNPYVRKSIVYRGEKPPLIRYYCTDHLSGFDPGDDEWDGWSVAWYDGAWIRCHTSQDYGDYEVL